MNKTFNKLIKTNIVLAVLSVFAVVIMIGGVSYALFFQKIESKTGAAFQIGNLEAGLSSSTGMIVLSDIFPTSASEIGDNNLYSFTLTNNGDYPLDYTIYLSDNTAQYKAAHSEYSSYTALSTSQYQYIDYKLDGGAVSNLGSIYNSSTKRMVLLTGTIAGGGTIETHTIQFWLDNGDTTSSGAPNSVAGKMLAVNVNLEGTAKGVESILEKIKKSAKESASSMYSAVAPTNTIGSVVDDNFSKGEQTYTVDATHQGYYMTYADSYTFNRPTTSSAGENYPSYTLTEPQVAKYSDIYSSLAGKYIVNYEGHNSSTAAYSGDLSVYPKTGLDRIYKVVSATANSITYIPSSYTMTFSNNSTTGVYTAEDDYGTSYYFRGNITDNHVKFGKWTEEVYRGYNSDQYGYKEYFIQEDCTKDGTYKYDCNKSPVAGKDMYWRIVRINGDGSLRLMYDGTEAHANGTRSYDRFALPYQAFNTSWYNNAYMGYMYGSTSTSATYAQVHENKYPSTIKTALETWYEKNFVGTEYESKIGDMSFCNDRSLVSGTGTGNTFTKYGAMDRLWINKSPSLICPQKANDLFTSNASSQGGNGKLNKPVGLLTADEVALAGGVNIKYNRGYYINNGYPLGLSSPTNYNANPYGFYVSDSGDLNSTTLSYASGSAPVINLSAEAASQLGGSGTMDDPYHF